MKRLIAIIAILLTGSAAAVDPTPDDICQAMGETREVALQPKDRAWFKLNCSCFHRWRLPTKAEYLTYSKRWVVTGGGPVSLGCFNKGSSAYTAALSEQTTTLEAHTAAEKSLITEAKEAAKKKEAQRQAKLEADKKKELAQQRRQAEEDKALLASTQPLRDAYLTCLSGEGYWAGHCVQERDALSLFCQPSHTAETNVACENNAVATKAKLANVNSRWERVLNDAKNDALAAFTSRGPGAPGGTYTSICENIVGPTYTRFTHQLDNEALAEFPGYSSVTCNQLVVDYLGNTLEACNALSNPVAASECVRRLTTKQQ